MVSQTDKENIKKLKLLRQHKMNKAIVDMKKMKKMLLDLQKEKEETELELIKHQEERTQKHDDLFNKLQEKGLSSIDDFRQHQENNQQLIIDEESINQRIKLSDKKITEKRGEIKNHEYLLKKLNKKIESLKVLSLSYKIASKP